MSNLLTSSLVAISNNKLNSKYKLGQSDVQIFSGDNKSNVSQSAIKKIGQDPLRKTIGLRNKSEDLSEMNSPSLSVKLLHDQSSNVNAELKTKDQLIEKIKEWVKIDNEIRVLQKEQKKRIVDKKKVSEELIQVMRTNEIDVFDLNDGQIMYDKRNQKKPITKTALLSILTTYYKGDAVKASETNQYILDNREEVVREKIVRKITNPKNAET